MHIADPIENLAPNSLERETIRVLSRVFRNDGTPKFVSYYFAHAIACRKIHFSLPKNDSKPGPMHFGEFEFVFVECVPPGGHPRVDADVIEEDESTRADKRTEQS